MAYEMNEERNIEQRIMYLEKQIARKELEVDKLKKECRQLEYMQQRKYTMS